MCLNFKEASGEGPVGLVHVPLAILRLVFLFLVLVVTVGLEHLKKHSSMANLFAIHIDKNSKHVCFFETQSRNPLGFPLAVPSPARSSLLLTFLLFLRLNLFLCQCILLHLLGGLQH